MIDRTQLILDIFAQR
ncbi:MAG: hypothetical protein ACK2T7_00360, partial [Anaerolineales bacterium]